MTIKTITALVLAGSSSANALELALAVAAINQSAGAVGTTIRPAEALSAFDGAARFSDVLLAVAASAMLPLPARAFAIVSSLPGLQAIHWSAFSPVRDLRGPM